jgi:hypothetical protein
VSPRKAATPRTARRASEPVASITESENRLQYLAGSAAETAIDALIDTNKDSWQSHEDGSYTYGDRRSTYLTVGGRTDAETRGRRAVETILALGPETAQSFLFLMSRDLARDVSESRTEKLLVHVNEILDFKGLQRHKTRDYRPSQKLEEARRVEALNNVIITVDDTIEIKTGRGTRKKRVKLSSRLIEYAVESEATDLDTTDDEPTPQLALFAGGRVPYRFRVALGDWANPYRQEPHLVKQILAKIGKYRVEKSDERMAMHFALAFMFSGGRMKWGVGELLERTKFALPQHHPDRFRDGFESALDLLARDHLIGSWEYEKTHHLPDRKWLSIWASEYAIVLTPRAAAASAIPPSGRR